MASPDRIGRWAVGSLLLAGMLVVAGKLLDRWGGQPFWGGLVAAFGEAALIGGLADWFAVRALFGHPFGIPFPHTALIPRNRQRIIREIRDLVEREWLPRSLLLEKVRAFDFVGEILLPARPTLRPHLREAIRDVAGRAVDGIEPAGLAQVVAAGVGRAVPPGLAADWLADLVVRARDRDWLEPVARQMLQHLERWAASPGNRRIIRARLEQAATRYRERDVWKELTFAVAELVGGVDLDQAAEVIQTEIHRFAIDQLAGSGQLRLWLNEGLTRMEKGLRDDPAKGEQIEKVFREPGLLAGLVTPLLVGLRDELRARIQGEDTAWLDQLMTQLDGWLDRLHTPEVREQVNGWCRRLALTQVEQHHGVVGTLVEEQLGRLSEEKLSALIQSRVGEDLNWIRLNGTFVGGLIGVLIFLAVTLLGRL